MIEKNVGREPQPLSPSCCSFPFDAWIKGSKKRWLPQKSMLQDLQHSFCVYCSPAYSKPTKALWDNQVKSIVETCFFNRNPLCSLQTQASVAYPRPCCLHTGRPQTGLFCYSHHKVTSKMFPPNVNGIPARHPLYLSYFRCRKSLSQRSKFSPLQDMYLHWYKLPAADNSFIISQFSKSSKLIGLAGKRKTTTKAGKLLRHFVTVAALFYSPPLIWYSLFPPPISRYFLWLLQCTSILVEKCTFSPHHRCFKGSNWLKLVLW